MAQLPASPSLTLLNRLRRLAPAFVLALSCGVLSCGSWHRVGSEPPPSQDQVLSQLFDLPSVYRGLGRIAAGAPLPFVATVAFVAGPADSTFAVVSLSLENEALAFQKEGNEFVARYRVELSAQPATGNPVSLATDETVRVGTFQETKRVDESVLYQKVLRLVPGDYKVSVAIRDRANANQTRAEHEFTAPTFSAGTTTAPLLVYQVKGRDSFDAPLSILLSPRGTLAYGGDTVLAYVEGYRMPGRRDVPFEIRDERDSLVLRDTVRFTGRAPVESAIVRFSPESAPLGALRLTIGTGEARRTTSALVSFSQAWLVTNFDEMISLLRFFGENPALDALRKATPEERPGRWREFWKATDPIATTPQNEALDQYFARLAVANQRFRGEGIAGWRTDRGEVLIGLGEPDEIFDASPTSQGRIIRWTYDQYRIILYFQDETGFGRFRLTPASRAEFERALGRARRATDT